MFLEDVQCTLKNKKPHELAHRALSSQANRHKHHHLKLANFLVHINHTLRISEKYCALQWGIRLPLLNLGMNRKKVSHHSTQYQPRGTHQLLPQTIGHAFHELLCYPTLKIKGESTVNPGMCLPIRNLCMEAIALDIILYVNIVWAFIRYKLFFIFNFDVKLFDKINEGSCSLFSGGYIWLHIWGYNSSGHPW